jgi:hypothetical protein
LALWATSSKRRPALLRASPLLYVAFFLASSHTLKRVWPRPESLEESTVLFVLQTPPPSLSARDTAFGLPSIEALWLRQRP